MQLYQLDASLTRTINCISGSGGIVDLIMVWISTFAVPLLVVVVASQWWRAKNRAHNRHVLVAAGFSFLLGLALNQLILLFVQRARPYDAGVSQLLISPSADPSFPSDHATVTFAIGATFLLHGMRRLGAWFLAAALLVSFSRIYVGTHYVSDVIGGGATGIAAALVILALFREGTRVDRLITSLL